MADISIKQGAALLLSLTTFDDQGVAFPLTGVTYRAQVRDAQGNLVATLPLSAGPASNQISIAEPSTLGWPVGLLHCDMLLTVAGQNVISDTFSIRVSQAATQ